MVKSNLINIKLIKIKTKLRKITVIKTKVILIDLIN